MRPLRLFTHRVAALWILSRGFMSFLRYGKFAWMAYSRWGRNRALHRGTKISFVRQVNDLFMKINTPLALLAAARTLAARVNAVFTVMPRSLICSHFAAIYQRPLQIGQYEDRECRLLIGDGFYLHLTGDPIYETNWCIFKMIFILTFLRFHVIPFK